MIHKKLVSIRYKLASLALLLGLFGLLGTSAFAYECNNQSSTISDGSQSAHPYTCQKKNNVGNNLCGNDGSKSQTFGFSCGSTSYICQRCVCPGGTSWKNGKCEKEALTCEESNGFVLNADKTACVCPDGTTLNNGICEKTSGPALGGKCGKDGAPTTDNTQCECPDKSLVAFGVDCPTVQSPKTQTEEEKCLAKTGYQWNTVDQKCENCKDPGVCCGIKLNTNVPFVGRCITFGKDADSSDTTVVTEATAFPRLMGALTKIMTTFLLLICFGGILVGGVMVAASGGDTKRASEGKSLIGKVIIAIAVLGASGIILHLINPNFF